MQQAKPSPLRIIASLLVVWLLPAHVGATELEFSGLIACDLEYFEMCKRGKHRCRWGEVVDLAGKQTLLFDLDNKTIALFEGDVLVDKEVISSISIVNEVLYMHGTNPDSHRSKNGAGWTARLDKTTGELLASSLTDTQGDIMFGTCHNP